MIFFLPYSFPIGSSIEELRNDYLFIGRDHLPQADVHALVALRLQLFDNKVAQFSVRLFQHTVRDNDVKVARSCACGRNEQFYNRKTNTLKKTRKQPNSTKP